MMRITLSCIWFLAKGLKQWGQSVRTRTCVRAYFYILISCVGTTSCVGTLSCFRTTLKQHEQYGHHFHELCRTKSWRARRSFFLLLVLRVVKRVLKQRWTKFWFIPLVVSFLDEKKHHVGRANENKYLKSSVSCNYNQIVVLS